MEMAPLLDTVMESCAVEDMSVVLGLASCLYRGYDAVVAILAGQKHARYERRAVDRVVKRCPKHMGHELNPVSQA